MFEMLRGVAGLNVAATRFFGFDFHDVGPKSLVAAKRAHDCRVTFRLLGMMSTSVVLFKDRMMNDGCRHDGVAQTLVCETSLLLLQGNRWTSSQTKVCATL